MKPEIELFLLKLPDGARIIRISEPVFGLILEKRLDPKTPVAKQTTHWKAAFRSFLERETGAA